jgi:hypothetical protein
LSQTGPFGFIWRFSRCLGGDKLTIKSRRGDDNSPSPHALYSTPRSIPHPRTNATSDDNEITAL